MAAFLSSWSLVLDVYSSCSLLDEQLCQLHNRGKSPMTSVSVRNDRSQEVRVCNTITIPFRRRDSLLTLFTVVEKLSQEKLLDFIGNSILILLTAEG